MELAMIILASALLGWIAGGLYTEWRLDRHDTAPVPDYDVGNPINGRGQRGEAVEICGMTMYRM
jgi:hypothetical protein